MIEKQGFALIIELDRSTGLLIHKQHPSKINQDAIYNWKLSKSLNIKQRQKIGKVEWSIRIIIRF